MSAKEANDRKLIKDYYWKCDKCCKWNTTGLFGFTPLPEDTCCYCYTTHELRNTTEYVIMNKGAN